MSALSHWIVPVILSCIFLYGLIKGVNVFDTFLSGAREGLSTTFQIIPALVLLLTAVSMFKVSGALDLLTELLSPLTNLIGAPSEILPLALLRPISGSGAMVIFRDILQNYGPDSLIGRIASVMEGSTETTFYTIAVYYGATGIKKTRHSLPSALCADLAGMIMSVITVRLLLDG